MLVEAGILSTWVMSCLCAVVGMFLLCYATCHSDNILITQIVITQMVITQMIIAQMIITPMIVHTFYTFIASGMRRFFLRLNQKPVIDPSTPRTGVIIITLHKLTLHKLHKLLHKQISWSIKSRNLLYLLSLLATQWHTTSHRMQ